MNTKQFNGGQFNDSGVAGIIDGIVANFFDTLFICPPVTTFIAPQNRTVMVAATPVTTVIRTDTEVVSPWQ